MTDSAITSARNRPELENEEIEVTPEMIEAGERVYYRTEIALVGEETLVTNIFKAMMAEYHSSLYKHL